MISYLNDVTLGNLPINWVKKKIHTRLDSIDPRSGEVVLGQRSIYSIDRVEKRVQYLKGISILGCISDKY